MFVGRTITTPVCLTETEIVWTAVKPVTVSRAVTSTVVTPAATGSIVITVFETDVFTIPRGCESALNVSGLEALKFCSTSTVDESPPSVSCIGSITRTASGGSYADCSVTVTVKVSDADNPLGSVAVIVTIVVPGFLGLISKNDLNSNSPSGLNSLHFTSATFSSVCCKLCTNLSLFGSLNLEVTSLNRGVSPTINSISPIEPTAIGGLR